MPRVGKTHFAYTPAGRNKAEAFAKKTGQKVVHAKKGKPISKSKLKKAAKSSNPQTRKRANFALNVRKGKRKS